MRRKIKGQTMLEYALVIAVVVGAILAMQHYMRRGVAGKIRDSIDSVGDQYVAGKTTSNVTTCQIGVQEAVEKFGGGIGQGVSTYNITTPATTNIFTDAAGENITYGYADENVLDNPW